MWPFETGFSRAFGNEARRISIDGLCEPPLDKTVSIDLYGGMTEPLRPSDLGRLAAIIFGQAERDGASRVSLCFGKNGMRYTINGTDHEMVPPPSMVTIDLVRELLRASRVRCGHTGKLRVQFADCTVELQLTVKGEPNREFLEVSGFSGTAHSAAKRSA